MKPTELACPEGWKVGVKVWVERAGQAILGKGRLELLEGIDRWHSISAAARHLGISYRHAWLMIQNINKAAGEPLITAAIGGSQGGGARLTPFGHRAVTTFRQMAEQLQQAAAALPRRTTETLQSATTVHVAAAVCLEEVLGRLLTNYSRQRPEIRVRAIYGASDELADHVLAGAPVDLFLTAGPRPLGRLEKASLIAPKTRTVLAENTLAAVALADRRTPIRRSADLACTDVTRIALADPSTPLGSYSRDYLRDIGLLDRLAARAIYVDNSRAVGAAVRAGNADVGLVYGSDAIQTAGCRLLFRVRKWSSR